MTERLQKIISSAGVTSRRNAEKLIAEGRVTVNGITAQLGQSADIDIDVIAVEGKVLEKPSALVYIMLNKPVGYVTTLSDEKGRKNVTQLIDIPQRIYPVGRLDMYSEGLLLLTNDGEFANRLAHPRNIISKTYSVIISSGDIAGAVATLRKPLNIDGYMIRPADVELISAKSDNTAEVYITIHEGRNRQIRKMCELAGCRVLRLRRISEGKLQLGDLASGKWRYLTKEEIALLEAD